MFLISSFQAGVCFVCLVGFVLFLKCRFPCSISRDSASEGGGGGASRNLDLVATLCDSGVCGSCVQWLEYT